MPPGNPFDPMKNVRIQPFKMLGGQDVRRGSRMITGSARVGWSIGRSIRASIFKMRLEGRGYDPITIDAAVEAVKAGRDPAAILEAARQAYEAKSKQEELLRNPPPVHGSAS